MRVLEELVVPVCVRIIHISVTSVTFVDHHPRSLWIFNLVVSSDPELLHVFLGICGVVCSVLRVVEQVIQIYRIVASGLELSRSGRLGPSETSAVAYCGLASF